MKKLMTTLHQVINWAEHDVFVPEKGIFGVEKQKFIEFMDNANEYYKERQGTLFGPVTDRGKARLQVVENLIRKNDGIMSRHENELADVVKEAQKAKKPEAGNVKK